MKNKTWSWEVSIDTSGPALQRAMTALIQCKGKLLNAYTLSELLGRGVSAILLVELPEGVEQKFRDTVKPIEMCAPSRVQVGVYSPPDDGHPGRRRN